MKTSGKGRALLTAGVTAAIFLTGCEKTTGAPEAPSTPVVVAPSTAPSRLPVTTPEVTPPTVEAPEYKSTVSRIGSALFADMQGKSWRDGCLSGPEELRLVEVPFVDFGGQSRMGALVVHESVATDIGEIFEEIYAVGFPIQRVDPIEALVPDSQRTTDMRAARRFDQLAMDAGDTSAFNCRFIAGTRNVSEHGRGLGLDVNPIQNPYLRGDGTYEPAAGGAYLDRNNYRPGMLTRGHPLGAAVIEIFERHGWTWGGDWNPPDLQHFEHN
jgi:hypothetical protein